MVELIEEDGQLVIKIGGQEYAVYHFGRPHPKPFLYPVRAANGRSLVANEPTDHRQHHGISIGYARVGDVDCWSERHNSGRIVHRKFEAVSSGVDIGSFTESCDWLTAEGALLLTDKRTFTFTDTAPEGRVFDLDLTLSAPAGSEVSLLPTNEAGLPQIRVAAGLTARGGGVLTNAEGKKKEAQTIHQRSPWVDCSGKLGRLECGIALFDHPNNPGFPTAWFTRDYGPFAPSYVELENDAVVIAPDSPLRLRYRFYTHTGDAVEGRVQEAWETYRESVLGVDPSDRPRLHAE
jgi:hypothetical protein